jgi:hypothetical protein
MTLPRVMLLVCVAMLLVQNASVQSEDEVDDSAAGYPRDTFYESSWTWDLYHYSDSLYADFNCDGDTDLAYGTLQDSTFTVHVVLGPFTDSSKTSDLPICLGKGFFQNCLCAMDVTFQAEPLYSDSSFVLRDLEYIPDGYEPSKNCWGLNVDAGECDSFHCYWDHQANELSWWRL